jgi:hypothetical protein
MSELNNAIKPWLLANGFEEVDELPEEVNYDSWDYKYSNGEACIYFDEKDYIILARLNDGSIHKLHASDVSDVIACWYTLLSTVMYQQHQASTKKNALST